MAINLTEEDEDLVTEYLDQVLLSFKRDTDLRTVRDNLARAISLAAEDSPAFREHILASINKRRERVPRPKTK